MYVSWRYTNSLARFFYIKDSCTVPPHLNIFLAFEQRSFKYILQTEVFILQIKVMLQYFHDALPMTWFHCLIGHQFQQWTHIIEVIHCSLQSMKCWPLFQSFRQLSTPASSTKSYFRHRFHYMQLKVKWSLGRTQIDMFEKTVLRKITGSKREEYSNKNTIKING